MSEMVYIVICEKDQRILGVFKSEWQAEETVFNTWRHIASSYRAGRDLLIKTVAGDEYAIRAYELHAAPTHL